MIKTAQGVSAVTARSAELLREMSSRLTELEAENSVLSEKVASYERNDRISGLARKMEEQGLSPEYTLEEKIASIAKYQDLDQVETAIKLAGGGKLDLPRVTDSKTAPGAADLNVDRFHTFLVSGHTEY